MPYALINQLSESRLIPSKTMLSKYNLRDMSDITFLYFLALQLMYDEPSTKEFVIKYVTRTMICGNFNNFIYSGTDLYVLLHVLTGNNSGQARLALKDDAENEILSNKMSPNFALFRRYLMFMKYDRLNEAMVRKMLLQMQRDLAINNQNYKSMRILISQWKNISFNNKQLAMTRLLLALRHRAIRSDLLPELEKLARRKKLEIKVATNPETGKSVKQKSVGAPWWVKAVAGAAGAATGYKLSRGKKS